MKDYYQELVEENEHLERRIEIEKHRYTMALRAAQKLAENLHARHFHEGTKLEVGSDLISVLAQIEGMTSEMTESGDLTVAYMAGGHDHKAEIKRLRELLSDAEQALARIICGDNHRKRVFSRIVTELYGEEDGNDVHG